MKSRVARSISRVSLVLSFATVLLAGCKRDAAETNPSLSVFAASSLTEAFLELERGFEAANPGVDVALTFAGSHVLRLQIEQGASADVFASADESHMTALVRAGSVSQEQVFAHNELVVITPRDNPAGLESFNDLPRASRVVIGAENVPVGIYTRECLRRASERIGPEFASKVREHVVSEESNVRLVRAKVELGEADAAIVYRTDAVASERVRLVSIPEELNARADYYIGQLGRTSRPELARRWIAYVRSEDGRSILSRRGFVTGP